MAIDLEDRGIQIIIGIAVVGLVLLGLAYGFGYVSLGIGGIVDSLANLVIKFREACCSWSLCGLSCTSLFIGVPAMLTNFAYAKKKKEMKKDDDDEQI